MHYHRLILKFTSESIGIVGETGSGNQHLLI